MQIRPFRQDDLPVLRDITVEAFDGVSIDQGIEETFGPVGEHDWKWRKARHVDDDARADPDGIFVVEDAGRVVGYISTRRDMEAGLGLIPNLALVPDYRGQGLGRQLIRHAFDHFRRHGLKYAKIETLVQNDVGYGLYTSLGFREVARQIHFVADLNETEKESPGGASTKN